MKHRLARYLIVGFLLGVAGFPLNAEPKDLLPGPYSAKVIRVIDGDSLVVEVNSWLGQYQRVTVRLRGIDAAELRSGDPKALQAKARLEEWVKGGVLLRDIGWGKYANRVVARVFGIDGENLGCLLVQRELAAVFQGTC